MRRIRPQSVLLMSAVLACAGAHGQAQTRESAPPVAAARPIPYPVVPPREFQRAVDNGTRTAMGQPGPNYWQQWADYTLRARLVPAEKRLEGTARITYHNRSPDALPIVALHLFQNLHAEGVARNEPAEVTGGVELTRVAVGSRELDEMAGGQGPGYAVSGTILGIRLPEPVASGDSLALEIDWAFTIPQRGAGGRMGWSEDNLFHLAYWYPQMAVYDDVVGWQVDQFLGNAEFYLGFGSYDLTVEAPEGWVVVATGKLTNAADVLPAPILERYRRATGSDSVVRVLSTADFGPGKATARPATGTLTWRFRSDSVRDVAFSATRESVWDAARTPVGDRDGDGRTDYTLISTFWRTDAPLWREQWRYAQHSIAFLSRWTGVPYPWPHMTSVEGGGIIGGGMEFPMMTLIGSYTSRGANAAALYGVTAHELAHMWLPMIVGTDERRHSWMDEGTTSFNGGHATNDFYPGRDAAAGTREGYLQVARLDREGPIIEWSDYHHPGPAYSTASYSKPATLLNTLRALVGEATFDSAYQGYVRAWAYKHPKPWDFFNWFSRAAGRDLDWFWRTWYYETWTLDHAVGEVTPGRNGNARIVVEDHGWAPMPARVTITREGGETLELEVPVEVWLRGETRGTVEVPAGAPVIRVEIDAAQAFPDVARGNNVWEREGS